MGKRRAKALAEAWSELAYQYQELAAWRGEALKRVWLVVNTIEDDTLAETLRMAMVGDFIMDDDEGMIEKGFIDDDE